LLLHWTPITPSPGHEPVPKSFAVRPQDHNGILYWEAGSLFLPPTLPKTIYIINIISYGNPTGIFSFVKIEKKSKIDGDSQETPNRKQQSWGTSCF
jgi:hypothetical protein